MLQVDPSCKFMGSVTMEIRKRNTYNRRGRTKIHRDQAIVECFNHTLAKHLFGHQYAMEMLLPEGQWLTAWVKRLPDVVAALNNEVTCLTAKMPAKTFHSILKACWCERKKMPSSVNVPYLYQPGKLEGGSKRATDPIWSLKVYTFEKAVTKPNESVLYNLRDGPKRGFVHDELLVVPPNTQLPPAQVM